MPVMQPAALDLRMVGAIVRETLRAGSVHGAVSTVFPWVLSLSHGELDDFAAELERHLWPALELGQFTALWTTISGWRETADAYASNLSAVTAGDWLGQAIAMERPV